MIINERYIQDLIQRHQAASDEEIQAILNKATKRQGLSYQDIAILLNITDETQLNQLLRIAGEMKQEIYGNRIVMFAPLYISNYCVNNCTYCGYQCSNKFQRKRLTQEEIKEEVKALEKDGHKRLALEAGEDPKRCDINYIVDSIKTIYDTQQENGSIRRINVNIAATTVEEYKKLKAAEIGTYILFQETYHQETYQAMHPNCLKGNYNYHLTAFERAMEAGIDDVGAGVLFGLYDYRFEVLALMMHNRYLEAIYGVGFHTISVPRLKKAEGMQLDNYPHLIDDVTFKKIVAILRLAVPYTGIILSTRETKEMRSEMINCGISQMSAGSCTDVGGYSEREQGGMTTQFELADHRPTQDVLKSIMKSGHIPSYCTACYRKGRTGDRFMQLAKSGQIQNVCTPNALMTLAEYVNDYGDEELREMSQAFLQKELQTIPNEKVRKLVEANLKKIEQGERDLFL